jgi:hypothetical protein
MKRGIVVVGLLLMTAGAANAQDVGTTRGDKLMCKTQQSLREALKAIDEKDRQTLRTVQGCQRSVDGARVEVVQDNVSMLKIRGIDPGGAEPGEFWVLPDTVKLPRR